MARKQNRRRGPAFPAVRDTNAPPFGTGRANAAPRTGQQPTYDPADRMGRGGPSDPYRRESRANAPRVKGDGYVDQRTTRQPGGQRTRGFVAPTPAGGPIPGVDAQLQRDRIQRNAQASVNLVNNNPPLRDVSRQWQGDFQQQPRRQPGRGDPKPIQGANFNPAPTDAAIGLGTVHREMPTGYMPVSDTIIWNTASAADTFPAWGVAPRARDQKLRAFVLTEPVAASAFASTVEKYASLGWVLDSGPATGTQVMKMLHGVERGKGWQVLMAKLAWDYLTQDNGAFMEIVRLYADPLAPVVTLNHLDAGRCVRTGRWEEPVVYIDLWGVHHRMMWYQVADLTEAPSPVEMARGMQYCALTRFLSYAQIMHDVSTYIHEKVSGQFNKAIHLVGGVQSKTISEALESHKDEAAQQGLVKYLQPAVIASLDPNAKVSVATLLLAALPDGWDNDSWMKWYFTILALALGGDYQDFAPLSGGGMNAGAGHSSMLHLKSRGKGLQTWMNNIEQLFNFHGIMPQNAVFRYKEQDSQAEMEDVELAVERAQERQVRIMSGELTPQVARMIALSSGDLTQEQFDALAADPNAPASTPPAAFPGGPPNAKPGGSAGEDTTSKGQPKPASGTRIAGSAGSTVAAPKNNGKGNTNVGRRDPGRQTAPGMANPAQAVRTKIGKTVNTAKRTTTSTTTPRTKELSAGQELSSIDQRFPLEYDPDPSALGNALELVPA